MTFAETVARLRRTLHRTLSRRLALESERPFQQLLALRVVASGEVRTQADLAERLLVDAPAASRLAAKLEEDGLLKRHPGTDRRCVRLKVTKAARRELEVVTRNYAWLEQQVKQALSPDEYREAVRVLDELRDLLT